MIYVRQVVRNKIPNGCLCCTMSAGCVFFFYIFTSIMGKTTGQLGGMLFRGPRKNLLNIEIYPNYGVDTQIIFFPFPEKTEN